MKNKNYDFTTADKFFFKGNLGAVYSPKRTIFRVWQPFAKNIDLRLYNAENTLIFTAKMHKKNGVFEYTKSGDLEGIRYTFFVTRNGKSVESADPYARAVTPDGERGIVVDMRKNAPADWENQPQISGKDPIIYELSVRDFSMDENANFKNRGKFLAFCEKNVKNSHGDPAGMEYIKSLGITHIQLMPVFDFDFGGSEYNWGYNPRFYNAPSPYYSQNNAVSELRELIAAAHKNGIGVVADVVYNHTFSADDCAFGRIFPRYYFRGEGEYSNGSGCGNEFASERKMAQKFILDSLEFLAREYKFDGFRFDLMGLLDLDTMKKITRRLRKINPEILLYGEGWTGGISALPEQERAVLQNAKMLPKIAFFNDSFRDAVKGSVFSSEDCGYVNGAPDEYHLSPIHQSLTGEFLQDFWANNSNQTVNYVECHDNLTLFDKLRISLNQAENERVKAADKMSAALLFLTRGIVFFQLGQEFLRTKNGVENSYNSPDEINSIKWNSITENRETVEYYKGLIALRKLLCAESDTREFEPLESGFLLKIKNRFGEFFLLVNPENQLLTIDLQGTFEIYADKTRASATPLYTENRLCAAEYSILFARRINQNG